MAGVVMYELVFYETISGEQPFGLFVEELDKKSATDRTARTQLKQIMFHLDLLAEAGTRIGIRYAKHLEGAIWELTPGDNRVLFFIWTGRRFVLLHTFRKTTQKTPPQEITRAKREMADWLNRYPD
jgi:phage-related protein